MREKTEFLQDFSGGLNFYVDPNRISPKESPTCLNVYTRSGGLSKRLGHSSVALTASDQLGNAQNFHPYSMRTLFPNNIENIMLAGQVGTGNSQVLTTGDGT